MEVCGTHTMAVAKSGMRSLLPDDLRLLSGPGCPVCVTPQETIDYAIALAEQKDVIIATFGDMVRVPGSRRNLESLAPRIVYSPLDGLRIARENPGKNTVFIGVGFETTSPAVAATIMAAARQNVKNFYVLPAFKLIPPALDFIARAPEIDVDGFILPGHVSTIIGRAPYEFLAEKYQLPGCITGFEPIDILQAILTLVRQITRGESAISIEYARAVRPEGNQTARRVLDKVFKPCDSRWRGIGWIAASGLELSAEYARFDARRKYPLEVAAPAEPKGCICGRVLLGLSVPYDCALFGGPCTPLAPVGPCMVSSEGSCAAYYKYGDQKGHGHGAAIRGSRRRPGRSKA